MGNIGIQNLAALLGQDRADFAATVGPGSTAQVLVLAGLNLTSTSMANGYVLLDAGALGAGTPKTLAQIMSNTADTLALTAALTAVPAVGSDIWLYTETTVNVVASENVQQVGAASLPTGQSGNPNVPVTFDGATTDAPTNHEATLQLSVDSIVVPLAANGTYTTAASVDVSGMRRIFGTVISDQAGTLYVQQSSDNANWDVQSSFTVAANDAVGSGTGYSVEVVAPYARLYYTNGATAQTVFRLYAWAAPEA